MVQPGPNDEKGGTATLGTLLARSQFTDLDQPRTTNAAAIDLPEPEKADTVEEVLDKIFNRAQDPQQGRGDPMG